MPNPMPQQCRVLCRDHHAAYHAVIAEMPSSFCPRCHRPDNAEMLSSTATASTRTRDAPTTTQPLPLMLPSLSHALQPSLSTITSTPGTHNPLLFSASPSVFSFSNPVPAHTLTSSTTSSTPPHSLSPQTHPLTSSPLQTPFATTSKPTARPSVQLLLHHLLFP